MKNRSFGLLFAFVLTFLGAAAAQNQTGITPDDVGRKMIVQRARAAYYSLRALGLDEYQSTIKPNWEQVLKGQGVTDSAQMQNALKLLNGIHFTMLLDKDGKVTVTHKTDIEPVDEQVRKGFNDIYSGIDQAVSGFFATWSLFILNPPFPEINSEYRLEDLGSQYRLSYKEGTSDIVTTMGRDLAIQEVKVTSPQFISVVKPHVSKNPKGFVLTGYAGDYTPTSGPGVVHLEITIDHQPVQGLQLPVSLIADTTLDGTPTHMELAFSDFAVKAH